MPIRHATSPTLIGSSVIPAGTRVYAIGDIHGRFDLLYRLLFAIEDDATARAPAHTQLIVLGDFIDRGPASAKVLEVLSALRARDGLIVLKGNHEAALLDGLDGDRTALELWIQYGGDATLRSYGANDDEIFPHDTRALVRNVRKYIPRSMIKWLAGLPITHKVGPYLFVHAGIKPGVPLSRQSKDDLLWIRREFTTSKADHGVIVVHGHTVSRCIEICANRIGIDTGAYRTGRLSAIGFEGNKRWTLEAALGQES